MGFLAPPVAASCHGIHLAMHGWLISHNVLLKPQAQLEHLAGTCLQLPACAGPRTGCVDVTATAGTHLNLEVVH